MMAGPEMVTGQLCGWIYTFGCYSFYFLDFHFFFFVHTCFSDSEVDVLIQISKSNAILH